MAEGAGRNTLRVRPSRIKEAKNYLAEFYPEPKGGIHYHKPHPQRAEHPRLHSDRLAAHCP